MSAAGRGGGGGRRGGRARGRHPGEEPERLHPGLGERRRGGRGAASPDAAGSCLTPRLGSAVRRGRPGRRRPSTPGSSGTPRPKSATRGKPSWWPAPRKPSAVRGGPGEGRARGRAGGEGARGLTELQREYLLISLILSPRPQGLKCLLCSALQKTLASQSPFYKS